MQESDPTALHLFNCSCTGRMHSNMHTQGSRTCFVDHCISYGTLHKPVINLFTLGQSNLVCTQCLAKTRADEAIKSTSIKDTDLTRAIHSITFGSKTAHKLLIQEHDRSFIGPQFNASKATRRWTIRGHGS